jgi:two-component system cell cycle sensor histidine kinase/response regulator CckA
MSQGYHKKNSENNGQGWNQLLKTDEISSSQIVPSPFETTGLAFEQMKLVLESSPAGLGVVRNGSLTWANESFYEMLGYEMGSLGGENVRILCSTQNEYEKVIDTLGKGMEKYDIGLVETKLYRKDGTLFDCRIRSSYLYAGNPEEGTMIVVTDISELKPLQIKLQQAQKMEAIGVLASGVSHDFNNILMGIQGYLSLMQMDLTSVEKIAAHTLKIGKLVETAADLTGRLLGFARGGKYQIARLNLNDGMAMALAIFKSSRKDIIVDESFEKALHMVEGDPSQLEKVWLNILFNASQAMSDSGEMFVSTQNFFVKEDHEYPFEVHPGRYVEISIKDNGVGIDEKIQEKIFEPFFSTKEMGNEKGRGLGLSTVFGVIKNHGGFILVESKKEKGSVFKVYLPASHKLPINDFMEEAPSLDQMLKGSETILLVEDNEDILNVGTNFLEKLGYTPIVARNGLEAVEVFQSHKDQISLVVLDLVMPIMDGEKTFSLIKKIREKTKFLITTGCTIDEKRKACLNKECHGFIKKPFSLHDFSREIRTILDRRAC